MKLFLSLLLALIVSPAVAEPLPPPDPSKTQTAPDSAEGAIERGPSQHSGQQPVLIPPQNEPADDAAPNAAANLAKKNPGKSREFFRARREAQIARREAAKQRMRDFKAARAAHEQKLYEDWHERYLADTPVRVEYYRALSDAYRADAALAYERAAYINSWYFYAPPFIPVAPIAPIYAAPYPAPIYGTIFIGW